MVLLKLYSGFCVYLNLSGKRICHFLKIQGAFPNPKEFKTVVILVHISMFVAFISFFNYFNQK